MGINILTTFTNEFEQCMFESYTNNHYSCDKQYYVYVFHVSVLVMFANVLFELHLLHVYGMFLKLIHSNRFELHVYVTTNAV